MVSFTLFMEYPMGQFGGIWRVISMYERTTSSFGSRGLFLETSRLQRNKFSQDLLNVELLRQCTTIRTLQTNHPCALNNSWY